MLVVSSLRWTFEESPPIAGEVLTYRDEEPTCETQVVQFTPAATVYGEDADRTKERFWMGPGLF